MSKRIGEKRSLQLSAARGLAPTKQRSYPAFAALNGTHPWQQAVPEGYLLYPVRELKRGEVIYFNFSLAKEMGLIPEDHPHVMTAALAQTVRDTFSLQIVNEFDQLHRRHLLQRDVKTNKYMATRYLQLQHANKQGKTSGDGRGIWNGCIQHQGKTWDVSSRGTGVTALAPGAVEAQRPLKTGAGEFGYGCGLADIDELMSSAVMSEIFHLQGINTERVLTVIDLGKGAGIGVRASPNLLRPAHLFLWLKQERHRALLDGTDHLIRRQLENKAGRLWNFNPDAPDRHRFMLTALAEEFARFAAELERNYIFAWLDWDGDNVLASAGIIDYGSVRQFGLRHDQYRYDDVQRFSTNLNEQKTKARLTVQVFAQLVDYLKTHKRKPLRTFSKHRSLKHFDSVFKRHLRFVFLRQVGFDDDLANELLETRALAVENLFKSFESLERYKTKDRLKRVADGINRPAIFKMRAVLRDFPAILRKQGFPASGKALLEEDEILTLMASSFARRRDLNLTPKLSTALRRFQASYVLLMKLAQGNKPLGEFLRPIVARAQHENQAGRITGNSAEFLIDEILRQRSRGLSTTDMQAAIDLFIAHQAPQGRRRGVRGAPVDLASPAGVLYQNLLQIALEFEEEI